MISSVMSFVGLQGQYNGSEARQATGGNWWKSPHRMTFMPPKGSSVTGSPLAVFACPTIADIFARNERASIDISSMIKYLTERHVATNLFIVCTDCFPPLSDIHASVCS